MIIAISDTHLGTERSNKEELLDFLDEQNEKLSSDDHFVLVGDVFDFALSTNWPLLQESVDVIERIENLDADVHYVIGNHDYLFNLDDELPAPRWDSYTERQPLLLRDGGKSFLFVHGYSLEVYACNEPMTLSQYEDLWRTLVWSTSRIGTFLKWLHLKWKGLTDRDDRNLERCRQVAESKARAELLDTSNDNYLVFGHTHNPYVGENSANTGCWVEDTSSYLKIEHGDVELNER